MTPPLTKCRQASRDEYSTILYQADRQGVPHSDVADRNQAHARKKEKKRKKVQLCVDAARAVEVRWCAGHSNHGIVDDAATLKVLERKNRHRIASGIELEASTVAATIVNGRQD